MSVFVDVGGEDGSGNGAGLGRAGIWTVMTYTGFNASYRVIWSRPAFRIVPQWGFVPLITAWRQPATGKGCDLETFSWRVRPQRQRNSAERHQHQYLEQLGECQGSLQPLLHQLIEMKGLRNYKGGKASWLHSGFLKPLVWVSRLGWEAMTVPLVCLTESGVEVG